MNRRMSAKDPIADAETLMLYASKLEQFAWHGEFSNKNEADKFQNALEQMVEREQVAEVVKDQKK